MREQTKNFRYTIKNIERKYSHIFLKKNRFMTTQIIDKKDNFKRNMEFLKNLVKADGINEITEALKKFNDTEIKFKNIKTRNLKDARI